MSNEEISDTNPQRTDPTQSNMYEQLMAEKHARARTPEQIAADEKQRLEDVSLKEKRVGQVEARKNAEIEQQLCDEATQTLTNIAKDVLKVFGGSKSEKVLIDSPAGQVRLETLRYQDHINQFTLKAPHSTVSMVEDREQVGLDTILVVETTDIEKMVEKTEDRAKARADLKARHDFGGNFSGLLTVGGEKVFIPGKGWSVKGEIAYRFTADKVLYGKVHEAGTEVDSQESYQQGRFELTDINTDSKVDPRDPKFNDFLAALKGLEDALKKIPDEERSHLITSI